MSTVYTIPTGSRFQRLDCAPLCPQCGCVMEETDRVAEDGSLYIWYECGTVGCDEQWLAKKPVSKA